MQMLYITAATAALVATNAHGAPPEPGERPPVFATPAACLEAARLPFRPESELRGIVEETLGYRVHRIATDAGCYAVHASDRQGTRYETRFLGSNLKMVSRYPIRDVQ